MKKTKDENLLNKIKEAFDSIMPEIGSVELPEESLPLGTFVRATKYDKLGIVTDAFYGDVDSDGKKIIIYTVLLFPERNPFGSATNKSEKFYVSNEYEYDVIAYLMMPPVDLSEFTMTLGGNFLL